MDYPCFPARIESGGIVLIQVEEGRYRAEGAEDGAEFSIIPLEHPAFSGWILEGDRNHPLAEQAFLALTRCFLYELEQESLFFAVPDGDLRAVKLAALVGGLPYTRYHRDGRICTLYRMEDETRTIPDGLF